MQSGHRISGTSSAANQSSTAHNTPPRVAALDARTAFELFLISALILFLELACIRWFPAHVLYLTFFTNTVLLASFLGMAVGCLAARHHRSFLPSTPLVLALALAAGLAVERASSRFGVDVGSQASPQVVFFGTEDSVRDVAQFVIPIELLGAFFFLAIALAFIGPGQELGRALDRLPDRVHAYTLNIGGSLAGILLFAACSWLELSPLYWFLLVALGLSYFLFPRDQLRVAVLAASLCGVVWLVSATTGPYVPQGQIASQHLWSPYYRVDYDHEEPRPRSITVNLIGHQRMSARDSLPPAYALPHILNRDAGRQPFRDVLIIGAGSGNDVSRALQWGAARVDAVEIDPVIYRLGSAYHPDRPYQDGRVRVHLDDGRNFLRATDERYDLVVYALVDSLVLHSSYSNIRLESYLFTRQAFEDVRRHLKPDGVFLMYNYFRQGWLVARLQNGLEEVFGMDNPLVLTLPYQERVEPDQSLSRTFTVFLAGRTADFRRAFEQQAEYWQRADRALSRSTPNGFELPSAEERSRLQSDDADGLQKLWRRFGLAQVTQPAESLRTPTDDWPFLYLRNPMIPELSLRGMAIMGALALTLLVLLLPRKPGSTRGALAQALVLDRRMFFLGAGFMLIETKAVVQMALLFGSTWLVNLVVFVAVLVMILAANLFVLKAGPSNLRPYYAGVLGTLALNALVPLDFFLGMARSAQIFGSCLLLFAPIFFAAVIFAVSFARSAEADQAFGSNIAGAMFGGLAEYCSMLLGFQHLMLLAMAFYALSAGPPVFGAVRGPRLVPEREPSLEPSRTAGA